MNHAKRVIKVDNPSSADLSTIKAEDVNYKCNDVENNWYVSQNGSNMKKTMDLFLLTVREQW